MGSPILNAVESVSMANSNCFRTKVPSEQRVERSYLVSSPSKADALTSGVPWAHVQPPMLPYRLLDAFHHLSNTRSSTKVLRKQQGSVISARLSSTGGGQYCSIRAKPVPLTNIAQEIPGGESSKT